MANLKVKFKSKKVIFNILLWGKLIAFSIYYFIFLTIFRIFKINNSKIVIINFDGKGYGDMGKYIGNELIKHNYKIYWAANKQYKDTLPKGIIYVKYNSLKYLFHMATAKVWINNIRFRYGMIKRKKQYYIQTWHAGITYKNVEKSAEKALTKQYILNAKNDSKMANLFISNSTYCTNLYKRDFWYDGEILECELPRADIIVNHDATSINKVKEYYKIDNDIKICLYAPTFRVDYSLDAYNIDYNSLINELETKFGGNWKVLVRLHPNISFLAKELGIYNENVISATDYPDMQELLIASDFMITDYSSCIFEFALSKKPALIYANDIEKYIKDRDFTLKLEDTPFPITTNNEELKNTIRDYNIEKYKKDLEVFNNDLGIHETGQASKIIVERINKVTGCE